MINKKFELLKYNLSKQNLSNLPFKIIIFQPWCEDTNIEKNIDIIVILNNGKSEEICITTNIKQFQKKECEIFVDIINTNNVINSLIKHFNNKL